MFIWCHDNLILNIKSIPTWTFAAASAVCICAKFCNSLLVWSTEMETQELTQHINISEKLEKTTKTTNNNMTIAIWTSRITFLHVWNEMCMRFILLSPHGTWYICVIVYTLLCLISLFFSLFTRRFLSISSHFLSPSLSLATFYGTLLIQKFILYLFPFVNINIFSVYFMIVKLYENGLFECGKLTTIYYDCNAHTHSKSTNKRSNLGADTHTHSHANSHMKCHNFRNSQFK